MSRFVRLLAPMSRERDFLSSRVMSCHVTSCHVMSRHVTSRHVMSCHVMSFSCRLAWYRFVWCQVASPLLVSCLARPGFSLLVRSCRVVFASCPVVSCRVVSCRSRCLFSCHVWFVFSRPCFFFLVSCPLFARHVTRCHVIQYHVLEGGERKEEERGDERGEERNYCLIHKLLHDTL